MGKYILVESWKNIFLFKICRQFFLSNAVVALNLFQKLEVDGGFWIEDIILISLPFMKPVD